MKLCDFCHSQDRVQAYFGQFSCTTQPLLSNQTYYRFSADLCAECAVKAARVFGDAVEMLEGLKGGHRGS